MTNKEGSCLYQESNNSLIIQKLPKGFSILQKEPKVFWFCQKLTKRSSLYFVINDLALLFVCFI